MAAEALQQRPTMLEAARNRVEVLGEHYKILLVVTEPEANLRAQGLTPYADWFAKALGIGRDRLHTVDAINEALPLIIPESGVVIGGSSHAVYEQLPWMQRLQEFIRAMADQQKPTLGVCFGHQIVAAALGGTVQKGLRGREFGPTRVNLTPEGQRDPLYRGLSSSIMVAMTHGDVVTRIPQIATVLATSETYSNQSLAIGDNVRTVQFHPEMTSRELTAIARHDGIRRQELDYIRQADVRSHGKAVLRNFARHFVEPYYLGIR